MVVFLWCLVMAQWIFIEGLTDFIVLYMGVNLRGRNVLMAQNLLKGTYVYLAVFVHEGGRCVTQLMDGDFIVV